MTLLQTMIKYSNILSVEGTVEAKRFLIENVEEDLHILIKEAFNSNGDPVDFDGNKMSVILGVSF